MNKQLKLTGLFLCLIAVLYMFVAYNIANGHVMYTGGTASASEFCQGGLVPTPNFCPKDTVVATNSYTMQTFGIGYEDDYTPAMEAQPADYSKQTTWNYVFIQGSRL